MYPVVLIGRNCPGGGYFVFNACPFNARATCAVWRLFRLLETPMTPPSSNFACLLTGFLVKRFDNGFRVPFNDGE